MSDIAARAGVSQSTVSFVLNERHTAIRISEETRQKVLAAAEELGYRNNRIARAVRTGKTRMMGVVGGLLDTEHVGAMFAGAIQEANRCNYTIKPLPELGDENTTKEIVRWSSEWRLTGVIALHLPQELLVAMHEESVRYGYPLVLLDTYLDVAPVPQIASDDAVGIRAAVTHLVEQGHTKIAYISGEAISTLSPLREGEFRAAMTSHGLEVPSHYVVNGNYHSIAPSATAARSLLQLPPAERPTAIFCGGDRIAAVTIQIAAQSGLRVPQDVSVIGTANLSIAELTQPPLTTIEQPFREMGRVAVRRLIEIAEPEDALEIPATAETIESRFEGERQLLQTRLIQRDSVARLS